MWPNLIVEKFLSKCSLFDQSNVKSNHSVITGLGMNTFTNASDWIVCNSSLKIVKFKSYISPIEILQIKNFCNLGLPSNFIKKLPLKIYHSHMK